MSFIPIVAEGLLELGVLATDITGSAFVGSSVQTVATGVVNGAVAEGSKNAFESGIDAIFGSGTAKDIEKESADFAKKSNDVGKAVVSSYYGFSNDSGLNVSKPKAPTVSKDKKTSYSCSCMTTRAIDLNHSDAKNINQPIINMKLGIDTTVSANNINSVAETVRNGFHKGDQINNPINFHPVSRDPREAGADLGAFISLTNSLIQRRRNNGSKIDISEVYKEALVSQPNASWLVPKIAKFAGSLVSEPKTEEYLKIKAVYNGRSLDKSRIIESVNQQGLKVFTGYDETGSKYEWVENKKQKLVIPTINGNWTGPYSKNNAIPSNLLDTFAFYHDIDYLRNGFFDLEGDYKLVSRIMNNLNRMQPYEQTLAVGTAQYFSTLGHSLAKYKGSLPKTVATEITDIKTTDDILPHLLPELVSDENYKEHRMEFYNGLVSGIKEEANRSSVFSTATSFGSNPIILQEFDAMIIQLE